MDRHMLKSAVRSKLPEMLANGGVQVCCDDCGVELFNAPIHKDGANVVINLSQIAEQAVAGYASQQLLITGQGYLLCLPCAYSQASGGY